MLFLRPHLPRRLESRCAFVAGACVISRFDSVTGEVPPPAPGGSVSTMFFLLSVGHSGVHQPLLLLCTVLL